MPLIPHLMNRKHLVLLAFIILKFALQYTLISPEYDLQRDEYLHLDQANHLAWGYLSVPPFTSWISFLIKLLGNSVFWVRFFPALFGALTILVVWKTIEHLKGSLFACILGAACVLFSALLRLNGLYQPNSLDVFCWTAFYFILTRYFTSENSKWLYVAAILFVVGLLNKYNIIFMAVGLFPSILLTDQRRIFLRRDFYLALMLAFVLALPNLWWQYQNGFPIITHMKQLSETQLVNVDRFDFLKSQLLFFAGGLVTIIAGLYALAAYRPFEKYRALFWAFFLTLAVFLFFKAKDYYAIGLYPIFIAFGAAYLGSALSAGWKRYLQPILLAIPLLYFWGLYSVAFPNKSPGYIVDHPGRYKKLGMLRWEDGRDHPLPQDFADMLGWKELASKVDALYSKLPRTEHTLVLCDNYGQAGAINYYTTKGIKAVSFNADYVNWFDLEKRYTNLLRVKEYGNFGNELEKTRPYFETSLIADSITNPFAREHGTRIFLFAGAKIDIRNRIRKEIAEVKRRR